VVLGQVDVQRGDEPAIARPAAVLAQHRLLENDDVAPVAELDARVRRALDGASGHGETFEQRAAEVPARLALAREGDRHAGSTLRCDLTAEEGKPAHVDARRSARSGAGARLHGRGGALERDDTSCERFGPERRLTTRRCSDCSEHGVGLARNANERRDGRGGRPPGGGGGRSAHERGDQRREDEHEERGAHGN
jgi:hypothetical protein